MTSSWKEWEGRTIDGRFLLGNYLGGSDGSAVFRTQAESGDAADSPIDSPTKDSPIKDSPGKDAAIKLAALRGAEAESQLRRWQAALDLNHPNLLRILKIGRSTLDGRELVYAVEELAEENLAQIVPERALTSEEVHGMLAPVLAALEFIHAKGLAHTRIRPSNILAAGDQVKLSSDTLRPTGEIPPAVNSYDAPEVLAVGVSPASDVWSLGITLVEVLTQRVPAWDPARLEIISSDLDKNIPEPFRTIVQRCLQVDPAKRASLREIGNRLEGGKEPQPEEKPAPATAAAPAVKHAPVDAISASARKRANGPYLLVLAAAIVVTIFLIMRPRPSTGPAEDHTLSAPPQSSLPQNSAPQSSSSDSLQTSSPPSSPSQTPQTAPPEPPPAQAPESAASPRSEKKSAAADDIVERATPQVAPSARRTISGKIKVRVRVEADASGNVTEAKLKDAGPSQYFAKAALEAARRWKFAPAPGENRRDWILLFAFTRARTEMSATRAR